LRPALYTFVVGVAIKGFVAVMILPWRTADTLSVCGGTQTTGPNGEIECGALPPMLSNGVLPLPIDYR